MTVINWIYYYGTWDLIKKHGNLTLPTIIVDGLELPSHGFPEGKLDSVDYEAGEINLNSLSSPVKLSNIFLTTLKDTSNKAFSLSKEVEPMFIDSSRSNFENVQIFKFKGRYVLDISIPARYAVLQDSLIGETILNQLFLRKNPALAKYFELISTDNNNFQMWKVLE